MRNAIFSRNPHSAPGREGVRRPHPSSRHCTHQRADRARHATPPRQEHMRPRPPCCGRRQTPEKGWALASSGRPGLHPGWPRRGASWLRSLPYPYTRGLFMRMENGKRSVRTSVGLWRMFCRSNATFAFIFLQVGLAVSDTPRPRLGLRSCRWDRLGPSVVFGSRGSRRPAGPESGPCGA